MDINDPLPFRQIIYRNRFLYLLIFIFILIAIQPLDAAIGNFGIVLEVLTTAILVSAIYTVSQQKSRLIFGLLLALPTFVSMWLAQIYKTTWLALSGNLFGMFFFGFIIITVLILIFNRNEITRDLIAGAAAVYLLMAVVWTYAYQFIELIQPGSFTFAQSQSSGSQVPFLYYSFVTLTTLGYGDVTPLSTAAKSCAVLEAVIGQLYLVITVAWLVGVHISQSMDKKSKMDGPIKIKGLKD